MKRMTTPRPFILALGMITSLLIVTGHAWAQASAFSIPKNLLSPNQQFGILVPDAALISNEVPTQNGEDFPQDKLVEVKTGKVLAVIPSRPRVLNDVSDQNSPPPYWAADNSLLIWLVEGKWSSAALSLYKFEGGVVKWQLNLLEAARLAMLNRTLQTSKGDFAPIPGVDHVDDVAYPSGFTIDVYIKGAVAGSAPFGPVPVTFPLDIHADLTSDPKGLNDNGTTVNAQLDGRVDPDGKFTVTHFHLGKPTVAPRNWDVAD